MDVAPLTSKNSSKEEVIDYGDDIEIIDGPYEPSSIPPPPKDIKPRIQYLEVKLSPGRHFLGHPPHAFLADRAPAFTCPIGLI
jgi:hypothetical protein